MNLHLYDKVVHRGHTIKHPHLADIVFVIVMGIIVGLTIWAVYKAV